MFAAGVSNLLTGSDRHKPFPPLLSMVATLTISPGPERVKHFETPVE